MHCLCKWAWLYFQNYIPTMQPLQHNLAINVFIPQNQRNTPSNCEHSAVSKILAYSTQIFLVVLGLSHPSHPGPPDSDFLGPCPSNHSPRPHLPPALVWTPAIEGCALSPREHLPGHKQHWVCQHLRKGVLGRALDPRLLSWPWALPPACETRPQYGMTRLPPPTWSCDR